MRINTPVAYSDELATETDPDAPEVGFSVATAIDEIKTVVRDARWFMAQMDRNEQTRLCWWEGKNGTGKKLNTPQKRAKPFNEAPDHESHLTQEVIRKRNAMRIAALVRGNLKVTEMESRDAARASMMRTVMRYYLNGAMKSQVLVHGTRAGSWADRWGHSIMYVGWKEEKGVEPITMTLEQMVELFAKADPNTPETGIIDPKTMDDYRAEILDPGNEVMTATKLAAAVPGLLARGKVGVQQARKGLRQLRAGGDAVMHGAYIKRSAPVWEALRPFVDVFYPAETCMEDNLESCRWVARLRWYSAQQLKEQAAIKGWDQKWLKEVLEKHKGKAANLDAGRGLGWAFSGAGVRWQSMSSVTQSGRDGEAQKHLYQIVELWDRSTTADGLSATYHTVLHADVDSMIAKRELRSDWHGCLPFVPFTCEVDETGLLMSRGVPEITMTPQHGIKIQLDTRSAAAQLTTFPPWTGPAELAGMNPSPGKFLETIRGDIVKPLEFPRPDGRSVEIENALRASVDRYFGLAGDNVPDAVSMTMGQAEMDWYLASISQCVRLTSQLVQQYMPPQLAARISGTTETFTATPDDVRGGFDFNIGFDVRALDMEWAESMLTFADKMIKSFDNRGDVVRYPLLEFGFNILDSSLAARCLPGPEASDRRQEDEEQNALTAIFTGGAPEVNMGINFGGRAEFVVKELQRSPERQQLLMSSVQIFIVFTERLSTLVNNEIQHQGQNARTGQTLGKDPLQQETKPQKLLAFLESLQVDWNTQLEELQAAYPALQQTLQSL